MFYCDSCAKENELPTDGISGHLFTSESNLCYICFEKKKDSNFLDDIEYLKIRTKVDMSKFEDVTYTINSGGSNNEEAEICNGDIKETDSNVPLEEDNMLHV